MLPRNPPVTKGNHLSLNGDSLLQGTIFDFLFSQESTCYPKLGIKVLRNPVD